MRLTRVLDLLAEMKDNCNKSTSTDPKRFQKSDALDVAMAKLKEKTMEVKYTLDNGAYAPEKAHYDDAGFDLRLPDTYKDGVTVNAGGFAIIDLGVHMQIPHGYVGMLKSKSGLNVKHSLRGEGVIDAGYTGSIVAKIYNDHPDGYPAHKFLPGDKVIQIVILPTPDVELKRVVALDNTERMLGGFGSTGR